MRVRAGIITGLHLQYFDSLVQGSELYSSIGTFQSSASARTNDLPTNIPNSCTKVCSASTVYLRVLVEEFIPEQNTTQTIRLIHG